jgi:hypothetical protein
MEWVIRRCVCCCRREGFLDELARLSGGREARDAIEAWLDKYGMRCVGEIDITRPLPLRKGNDLSCYWLRPRHQRRQVNAKP